MKKLVYEVIGNLYEIAFPKKLIKDRRSLLLIVLESCRYMNQNETVDHADNIMVLAVNDMNRLFFCKEKKMYSIVFPFHTECNQKIHFDLDGIDISPAMISNLCTVIESEDFNQNSSFDFFSPILEREEGFSKDFWYILRYLMTYELGYIRYDDDIDGFKEAAKKGVPKQHPRYHYDVNYSQQAAFKIGLDKKITPDKFIQLLDDTLERKSLRG